MLGGGKFQECLSGIVLSILSNEPVWTFWRKKQPCEENSWPDPLDRERRLVCPFIQSALETCSTTLRNELPNHKCQIDRSCENSSKSKGTDLRSVSWGDDNIKTVCKSTKNLSSTQHSNRCRKELNEDKDNRPDTADSQCPFPPEAFEGPATSESTENLTDRVSHSKTGLPWRGNDIKSLHIHTQIAVGMRGARKMKSQAVRRSLP